MRIKRSASMLPPNGIRAMVPLFAVQGGAGRSTLAGLLAQVTAPTAPTVLIDTAARSASPWGDWLGIGVTVGERPGIAGLVDGSRAPDRAGLDSAKTRRQVPTRRGEAVTAVQPGEVPGYDVLTDTRLWTRPAVAVPDDPRWYAGVLATGGWAFGVIDNAVSAVGAHIEARNASRLSMLDLWFARADAVPVLVATSSAAGPSRLQRLASLLDTDGLDASRAVAVIVDTAGGDRPKWLAGEIESLSARVGRVVQVPFDRAIHADELTKLEAVAPATLRAVREVAVHVVSAVQHQPEVEEPRQDPMAEFRAEVQSAYGAAPQPAPGRSASPQPPSAPPQPPPAPAQPSSPPATGWVPGRG